MDRHTHHGAVCLDKLVGWVAPTTDQVLQALCNKRTLAMIAHDWLDGANMLAGRWFGRM
jgi:hypothetical protein